MARRSCEVYCEDEGLSCIGAWEGPACGTSKPMDCDRLTGSATMTCHCIRQGSKESQQHAHERHRHGKAAESSEDEDSWGFHCRRSDIEAWSEEKRWWCCRELEVGCETTASKSFSCDPSDDFEMWEEDKQRFCCREEGLCAEEEGESEYSDSEDGESEDGESAMLERETSDEDGESYDCEQLLYQEAEAFEAMDWCCSHRGIGCRQTQRCDAEALQEVSWSSDDRRWCCEHEGLGCDELQVTERYSMAGLKRAVLSRGRQALHSLERALGPSSIGMLAGVVLLSALHMLCKACSAPAARDKAILLEADGYRPVPLQAEDD